MMNFDIIVVGGGHAGCEAAGAASRRGARVALVTLDRTKIGVMSCNPAFGGVGKGHLIREIDALDGLMGRLADVAAIHYRLLNRRRGPAVRGPRVQADREIYQAAMQRELSGDEKLTIIEGEVVDLRIVNGILAGVRLGDGSQISSRAVVITAGTYLRGRIHIGNKSFDAGRMGEQPAKSLSSTLEALGASTLRFKTGTPARLLASSIDFSKTTDQPSDSDPVFLSDHTHKPNNQLVQCSLTSTNSATMQIIRDNLALSAMGQGAVTGLGPRYCPSIEDKAVKFAHRDEHQIFLEPEGLNSELIYPNGISTSLPEEVQEQFLHSIPALAHAKIMQPGYAIEYDAFDPRGLDQQLQSDFLPGLFMAGQVNGTTGYEEAAAQGLVAGANAVSYVEDTPLVVFSRSSSYIGVLVDDLSTRGVTEPYRMLTSRSEYRLTLRWDNADTRLNKLGQQFGLISETSCRLYETRQNLRNAMITKLKSCKMSSSRLRVGGIDVKQDGQYRSAFELLARDDIVFEDLVRLWPNELAQELTRLSKPDESHVEAEAKYRPYLVRQEREIAQFNRSDDALIPIDIDYALLTGLSAEVYERLVQVRPSSVGQAARIPGVTPAAIVQLIGLVTGSTSSSV